METGRQKKDRDLGLRIRVKERGNAGDSRGLGFRRGRERERKSMRKGRKKPGENVRGNHCAPGDDELYLPIEELKRRLKKFNG